MGVPAGGDRNELDCRLRDELDDGEFFWRRRGTPLWMGALGFGEPDFPACNPRFCGDLDLLARPVLDVPAQDFPEDLSD